MSSSSDDTHPLIKAVAWVVVFFLAHAIGFAFSEDAVQAKRATERLGYQDVTVGESKMFADWRGCGFGDYSGYDAEATVAGSKTELLVCCGVFSGCYARTADQ